MIELLARWCIPDRDNVTSPSVRRAYGTLCGIVGIALNILLFAGKFFAGQLSGSIAVTADAFNNLSDAGSSAVTLLGFRLAGRKPDTDHPFGHGRIEYISGLAVAGLILLMGVELAKSSFDKILHPEEVAFSALALGILIYLVYRKFYTGVVYSRSFAVTLVGMCVLTCMVTLAISTNIVISLGMVGALSIVRFRTAIKDPMDLLYLFWAITSGITAGAGMYVLAVLAAVIMIVMIYLFYHRQQNGKIYIVVIHYTGDDAGDEIIRNFGKIRYFIKSKTMRKEKTEMAVEVFCRQNQMDFTEKIRKIENVDDVTLIQYNGEYHG